MKHNLRKLSIIITELMFIIGFSLIYNFGHLSNSTTNIYAQTEEIKDVKISGTYENITIDNLPGSWNNWSWAENQIWCSGLGTLQNPYIIQGHTLGVDNVFDGIRISNSHNIYFKVENCTFIWDGFIATGMERGIQLANSTDGFIINNTIHGISNGVNLIDCEDLVFNNNTIYSTMGGLYLHQTNSSVLYNNVVHNTENGISLYDCEDNLIHNNTVYSNEYGLYITYSEHNDIYGNSADDNNIVGIYLASSNYNNITGNTASGNDYGIYLNDDCLNNTISGNSANNNGDYGIYIYSHSDYNTISKNTVNDNRYSGISLEYECYENIILGNTINNSTNYGIYLYDDCGYTTIANNFVNASGEYGISLHWYSQNNTIRDNIANYNGNIGIEIYDYCENNMVSNNVVNFNGLNGIGIYDYSDNNILTQNIMYNNTIGLRVDDSDNNSIYENAFAKNGKHAYDDGIDNKWNGTTIGNYWDNHTAPDVSPQDGIVDTPYTFIDGPSGSIDFLPIAEDGAPRITINSPQGGRRFSNSAPSFNVEIVDVNVFEMWYTLDGGLNNYTFTENGTINQAAWDALTDGSVTIRFYARDIIGNEAFEEVTIIKGISADKLDPGVVAAIVVSVIGGIALVALVILVRKGKISLEKIKGFSFKRK